MRELLIAYVHLLRRDATEAYRFTVLDHRLTHVNAKKPSKPPPPPEIVKDKHVDA